MKQKTTNQKLRSKDQMSMFLSRKTNLLISFFLFFILTAGAQVNVQWMAEYQSNWQIVDYGRELKVDAAGNVFVGGHSLTGGGHGVVTFVKYNSQGNQVWEYHSPTTAYAMEDMVMDEQDNIYYTGYHWVDSTAEWDLLTAKIDSNGNDVWSSIYDGNGVGLGWDLAMVLTIDAQHNVYITGYGQGSFNGYDFETIKYNASGQQQWEVNYTNPDNQGQASNYFQNPYSISTDAAGNVYVSGYLFNGTTNELALIKYDQDGNFLWIQTSNINMAFFNFPNRDYMKIRGNDIYICSNIQNAATGCDIALYKYDTSGTLIWRKSWNSNSKDSDFVGADYYSDEALLLDNDGNIFVSGTTRKRLTLFTEDIVTLKYNPNGDLIWSDVYNGPGNDQDVAHSIQLDQSGNAYVCGVASSSHAFGAEDYVTFKLNGATGNHEWLKFYNGITGLFDEAHALFVDDQYNVYVTGWSETNTDPLDLRAQMVTIKYGQPITGIDNVPGDFAATVFPNPANESISIRCNFSEGKPLNVYIENNLGEMETVPVSQNSAAGLQQITIDARSLADGMYYVVLAFEGAIHRQKISVIHP